MIKLTEELIDKGVSSKGGHSDQQIKILGETKSKKGWRKRLINKIVSEDQFDKFLKVKDDHLFKSKKVKQNVTINVLADLSKFTSEQQLRKCIQEEYKYGREINISRALHDTNRQNKFFRTEIETLNKEIERLQKKEIDCYCQDEIVDEAYEQFLNKTC